MVYGLTIQENQIPDLMNSPEFIGALRTWQEWKEYQYPYGNIGYLNHPCIWWDIITMFDKLFAEHMDEKMKKAKH